MSPKVFLPAESLDCPNLTETWKLLEHTLTHKHTQSDVPPLQDCGQVLPEGGMSVGGGTSEGRHLMGWRIMGVAHQWGGTFLGGH